MSKIALVLSGGGFQGAFQIGAIQVLREHWNKLNSDNPPLKFDIVSGVSAGALNGLLTALNKFEELEEIWNRIATNGVTEIYRSDIINTNFEKDTDNPELKYQLNWKTLRTLFPRTTHNLMVKGVLARNSIFKSFREEFQNLKAIADNTPLHELLKKYAKKELLEECKYKCGFVSLDNGKYYSVNACDFDTDEDFAKGVLASTSMPIIWPPVDEVKVNGETIRQCVDGGVRNVSPLRHIIEEIKEGSNPEAYTIVIVNCSTGKVTEENFSDKNLSQIALRALDDIAITEIFNNDIRDFVTKNYFVKQVREKHPDDVVYDYDFDNQGKGKPLHYFRAIIIQPDSNVLGDALTANKLQIQSRIEHGRKKAIMALEHFTTTEGENKTTMV